MADKKNTHKLDQKKEFSEESDVHQDIEGTVFSGNEMPNPVARDDYIENRAAASVESVDGFEASSVEQAQLIAERLSGLFGGPNMASRDVPPLLGDPDKLLAGFKKIAEATELTLKGGNPAQDEEVAKYTQLVTQALQNLQEGGANLVVSDMANMFSVANVEASAEREGNVFLPFIQGMLQSLFSAEFLLPIIKDLVEKYGKFIEERGGIVTPGDRERYEKQLNILKVIEQQLALENPDDTPAAKREKFAVVVENMILLQESGNPPEEILFALVGLMSWMDPDIAASISATAFSQCKMM